jgi:hypothetical protein
LRRAEPEKVEQVCVEADHAAANARVEVRIEPGAAPQRTVHQLSYPAAIARVETRGPAIERRIEHVPAAKVGADIGGGDTRIGHRTAVMYGDASRSPVPTGRTMVLTRPWHTS